MIQVFRTRPHLVQKVWGGRKLASLFDKELPDDGRYGEAWEVADLPEGQSVVDSGKNEGLTLQQMVERYGEELVGVGADEDCFPLLVKLIEARHDLSVQVHPGQKDVHRFEGARAKDECWIILDVEADGCILHGFESGVSPESFREAVQAGRAVECLRRVEVTPGDVIRVAPGTVHAICAGVTLLEIQEPSDSTFRVWDYERPGLDGKPRPLHLEEALQVAYFDVASPDAGRHFVDASLEVLACVPAYRIERFIPSAPGNWAVREDSPQVVHVLRGSVTLDDVRLSAGQTAVVPARLGRVHVREPFLCELIVAGRGGELLVDRL